MKETTQLRKSFLGGYRREDVQEYFDELYEEAESKYKALADEHDRLAQENVLLRQWIGDDQDRADGLNLPDLHSEAAFDLPEGVYQFDPSSNKVLDLTHSSEAVEFKAVAAGHSFDVPAGLQNSEASNVKLTVLPNKAVEVKAKSEATPKKVVKELAQKVAQKAAQVEEAAEATVETESASKKTVESKPQLDYEQKLASEKVRQPKRYYVKRRSKSVEAQVEAQAEAGNDPSGGQATATQTNSQASTSYGETFTNTEHSTHQGFPNGQAPQYQAQYQAAPHAPQYQAQYQLPNQPSFNGQAYQQPYPTQGYQSSQFFQAPPAYYAPVQFSGQPMYQTAPVDSTLLARVEKLEAELTQTRAQLEFANGLLKELYK